MASVPPRVWAGPAPTWRVVTDVQWSEGTIARIRDHPHALSQVMGLMLTAALEQMLGRPRPAQEHAEAGLALARTHGFPWWVAAATVLRGWAVAAQGQQAEGIALMREGLAAQHGHIATAYFVSLLGSVLLRAGLADDGLALIAEAQKAVGEPGYLHRSELQRLRGELLLRSRDDQAEAEACFRQALDCCRQLGLKGLELRAALSLARLWQRQRKPREARSLVEEIYRAFGEDADTADLREARALLEELSAAHRRGDRARDRG